MCTPQPTHSESPHRNATAHPTGAVSHHGVVRVALVRSSVRAGLVDGLLAVDAADRPDVAEVVQLRIVQAQVQLFLLRVLDGAGKDANGRTWGDDVDGETLRRQAMP